LEFGEDDWHIYKGSYSQVQLEKFLFEAVISTRSLGKTAS
jgi:hypothetical protein